MTNKTKNNTTEPHLCACGCGEETKLNKRTKKPNRFIFGHQNMGENNVLFGKHHTEESKRKNSEAHKGKKASEETRKKLSLLNSGKNNSNYGKKMSDEQKQKISEAQKGRVHTEEHRRKNSEANMGEKNHFFGKHHNEETKKVLREVNIGKKQSDETRKKHSETNKRNKVNVGEKNAMYGKTGKENPFYGKKHTEETKEKIRKSREGKYDGENHPLFGKHHTEETKRKMSEVKLGKTHTEESKKKMSESHSGENHYNWQGGISYDPYCPKFNEAFKEKVREAFGRKCFICGKTEFDNHRKLSVHHVEYNKNCGCDNTLKCDFVPLCMSCHTKTSNSKREYWEKEILKDLKHFKLLSKVPDYA